MEKIRLHELDSNPAAANPKLKRRAKHNFAVTFGSPKFSLKWLIPVVIKGRFDMEELYE